MSKKKISQDEIKYIYQRRFLRKTVLPKDDPQLIYLLKVLPSDRTIRILDAGCGDGRYSEYLFSIGYRNIYAVDLFDGLSLTGVDYQCASVDNLPFPDCHFDFIFSNSVIFYVDPPSKVLKEFRRALKPRGGVLFTAHTKWSLFTLKRIVMRDLMKSPAMRHLEGVKFYSAYYYNMLLRQSDFEILLQDGWRTFFFLGPVLNVLSSFSKKFPFFSHTVIGRGACKNRLLGTLRSEVSYHSVFFARKLPTVSPLHGDSYES